MPGIISAVQHFCLNYGRAAVLALLLHGLLLAVLFSMRPAPPAPLPKGEPVITFLYQPPVLAPVVPQAAAEPEPAPVPAAQPSAVVSNMAAEQQPAPDNAPEPAVTAGSEELAAVAAALPVPGAQELRTSLAQRALQRAVTADPAVIEQAAAASYQQFLQAQHQPKISVEKQHQALGSDPAHTFSDGRQLLRTASGCHIADPSKDGFEGLMAARKVLCGDEISSSDLLKQALEKHTKR